MPKLNQILAIEKGTKNEVHAAITELHHKVQKADLVTGLSRTYKPKDEEGERLPGEAKIVQVRANDVLDTAAEVYTKLFDVTLTKDLANTRATADVEVDGKKILTGVPVTNLLFLEKQMTDIVTFIRKIPVLDPSEEWRFSKEQNCYATQPSETARTKKIPRNHVRAEATDKHPAQVDVFTEDVVQGFWSTIKYSGALPASRIAELLDRATKLQKALKFAREQANMNDAPPVKCGEPIFGYLFAE